MRWSVADPKPAVPPDIHRHVIWQTWHMCETDCFARRVTAEWRALLAAVPKKAPI